MRRNIGCNIDCTNCVHNCKGKVVTSPKKMIWCGILIIIIITLFIMAFYFFTSWVDPSKFTETKGVVVDNDVFLDDGSLLYSPVAEYKVDGETYTVKAGFSTIMPKPIGKE